jgi:hypothetical protein
VRDIGQSRAAEPRPQLEPLLKCLLVIFIRCGFDDNSVVPFTDFAALFGLVRTMCGSRTGGWSLPCVVSD